VANLETKKWSHLWEETSQYQPLAKKFPWGMLKSSS
jgi:hypothetical protein